MNTVEVATGRGRPAKAWLFAACAGIAMGFALASLLFGHSGSAGSTGELQRAVAAVRGAVPRSASGLTDLDEALIKVENERDSRELLLRTSAFCGWFVVSLIAQVAGARIFSTLGKRVRPTPEG